MPKTHARTKKGTKAKKVGKESARKKIDFVQNSHNCHCKTAKPEQSGKIAKKSTKSKAQTPTKQQQKLGRWAAKAQEK